MNNNENLSIGITVSKTDNPHKWYKEIITKCDLIDYTDISGCYVYKNTSYTIWEQMKKYISKRIKLMDIKDYYFPLFVSQHALFAEKEHISDFSPEVAWVTKTGDKDLAEPIAVRPTSETIMYPLYAKWITSHRNLPLKCNQWNNVVRWEFKKCIPFLRSREFLWQEGHTAFAKKEQADEEVLQILDLYTDVYQQLLAIPVIKGKKSMKEKFAGADYTTSVEIFIDATGRAIQGATSHSLGQNFSKMFNVSFENEQKETEHVWQNSWGITTRTIGVITLIHGDNKGFVIPPAVAPIQIVIIPIMTKNNDHNIKILENITNIKRIFGNNKIRYHVDNRNTYSIGYKFNDWELKGVPLRLEIGIKDIDNNIVSIKRRIDYLTKDRITLKNDDQLCDNIKMLLYDIQNIMYNNATNKLNNNIVMVNEWDKFVPTLNDKKIILASWCEDIKCEEWIKNISGEIGKQLAEQLSNNEEKSLEGGAKSLCTPFEQNRYSKNQDLHHRCINPTCNNNPKSWTFFGRSY